MISWCSPTSKTRVQKTREGTWDNPGKELYFDNGKLIKVEDRSGEPSVDPNQEKKMYEARLPHEISELLDILKKK